MTSDSVALNMELFSLVPVAKSSQSGNGNKCMQFTDAAFSIRR